MKDVHLIALVIVGYLFGILVSVYKLTEAWTLSAKCNVEEEGTLVSVEKGSHKGKHGQIYYTYVPVFKYLY